MNTTRFRIITSAAAVALLALAARSAAAQRVIVRGQVTDAANGQPVAGALVHVGDDGVDAVTDVHGTFAIARVPAGDRVVWASALGYGTGMVPVAVAPGIAPVSITLTRDPVRLAALTATVSRFESRQRSYGGTVRVMRDRDLVASGAPDVRELLAERMGLTRTPCATRTLRIEPGAECVQVRGMPIAPVVYVDEVRWGNGMDLLASYRPDELARVEVYGGGQQVRVYTRWFLDWASQHDFHPVPLVASY